MLSIGKLTATQAKYYLDQAPDRVDVVRSVGDGLEEYYAAGPDCARGVWMGRASRELGLAGPVGSDELRRVLAGLDPRDGAALRTSSSPTTVGGFDLTFSAPKSASVLFGLGDDQMRELVRDAHDHAAHAAVSHLERSAAAVRRGHGGAIVEEASGLVASAFRHRTSRAGDPQLHTHVLVANLGRGQDGRWSALDGRRLYAHARSASFIYQAVLRAELTRTLGVEWAPVRKGIAEIIGIPRTVIAEFSRRRAEIQVALAEHGTTGARAAEAAALATRRPKDRRSTEAELDREWRSRAVVLGLDSVKLRRVLGRLRSEVVDERGWDRAWRILGGTAGLTGRAATFSRDEVIQGLCEALPPGCRIGAGEIEDAADRFLASREAVPIVPVDGYEDGSVFRRRDGSLIPVDRTCLRYSTPTQLALEQRLVDRAIDSRASGAGLTTHGQVERLLAERPMLSAEQRAAIEALCLRGDGVSVVAGRAGAGKTFTLGAAREAWQAAGHPVLGVATARRAAAELESGAGIASTSVAALLRADTPLPADCVLVVDEAGMVGTRQIAQLLERVDEAGGKLVLVGDHGQLPELEAGGTFRGLVQRGLATELRENVRQVQRWEREALEHLREGRAEPALALYGAHDRLVVEPTLDDARERLVRDWWNVGDPERSVMIAHRRLDVAELNDRARLRMRASGRLTGPELMLASGGFAAGDLVVVKRNDQTRGVRNGDRGRVVSVEREPGALVVDRGGEEIRLDVGFLSQPTAAGDPGLVHGYAITGHVAQGVTVDDTYVLATGGIDREWAYVALSRGRHSNRLYLPAEADDDRAEYAPAGSARDPLERLSRQLQRSSAQVLAIDAGRPAPSGLDPEKATQERQALEQRRFGWLPSRRAELEAAREREGAARRAALERRHGAHPFVSERELEERVDELRARGIERATGRVLRRERGMGREL